MIEMLLKLGLSEKEAKVYLAALALGSSPAAKIAEKADVNRPTTYVILEKLCQLGLATSYEKGKIQYFTAESPDQLRRLVEIEREAVNHRLAVLDEMLPDFKALHQAIDKPRVRFYEGKEGQIAMRGEAARNNKQGDIFSFVALDQLLDAFPQYDQFEESRAEGQVKSNVIYTHRDGPVQNRDSTDASRLRVSRYVPRDKYPFDGSVTIDPANGKIFLSTYTKEYMGIIIESESLTKTLKAVWDLSWVAAEAYND